MRKTLVAIPEKIETERLLMRPYQAGDGPMYYAASLRNRDHLAAYEFGNVLMHIKDEIHAEDIVCDLAADWRDRNCFFIGIFKKSSGEWVGQVYVGPTNWELPEFVIGFIADVNHQRKGYISEAVLGILGMLFTDLSAHRVKSDCNQANERSWRLLERCGFQREGHLRENKRCPDGTYQGDYLYGMLRSEFIKRE